MLAVLAALACGPSSARLDALDHAVAGLRADVALLADDVCPVDPDEPEAAPPACPVGADLPEEAGVVPVDDDDFFVARSWVDDILASPTRWPTMLKIDPAEDADGEQIGWQLGGIRRGGKVAAIGFRNGDVVLRVNGQPAADVDPDDLLHQHDVYVVDFRRRGEDREVTFTLVDG